MSPSAGLSRIQHRSLRAQDLRISKLDAEEAHDRSAEVMNIFSTIPSFALVYNLIYPLSSFVVVFGNIFAAWVLEDHLEFSFGSAPVPGT